MFNLFLKCAFFGYFLVLRLAASDIEDPDEKDIIETEAVAGTAAKLPCDISPRDPQSGDKLELVLWYKEGKTPPVYSYDARQRPVGFHWREGTFEGRSAFRSSPPAALQLRRVAASDGGLYRCRADFSRSRTKNTYVRLKIILPPEHLTILDDRGERVIQSVIGPYFEGATLVLTCVVTGGRPKPHVTWWYNDVILDETSISMSEKRVKNILHLGPLSRNDSKALIRCVAANNDETKPLSTGVLLDMMLPPKSVDIMTESEPLAAGASKSFICEIGKEDKNHSLVIFWKKENESLLAHTEMINDSGDLIWSRITFEAAVEDDGKNVSCCAGSAASEKTLICDEVQLEVIYKPNITLFANNDFNHVSAVENDYVIFNCTIDANPRAKNITWHLNNEEIDKDNRMDAEDILTIKVEKRHAGLYYCAAQNSEGITTSNYVWLEVKYLPMCMSAKETFDVSVDGEIDVQCDVDAYPPMTGVIWKLNSSADLETDSFVNVDSKNVEIVNGSTSILHYKLTSADKYGTLYCIAVNELGSQEQPCQFDVTETTTPEPPFECEVTEHTMEIIMATCKAGHDGGLAQEFKMDVLNSKSKQPITRVLSDEPHFRANLIGNHSDFDLIIIAFNKKGESEAITISTNLEEFKRLHTAPSPAISEMTPFMLALIGGVALVVLIACTIIMAIRERWTSPSGSTVGAGPSEDGKEIVPYNVDISGKLLLGRECCETCHCNYEQDAECSCDKESSEWSAKRSGSFKQTKQPKPDSLSVGVEGSLLRRYPTNSQCQDGDRNNPFATIRRLNQQSNPKDDEALLCLRNTCATLGKRGDNIRALSDHLLLRLPAEPANYSIPKPPVPCTQPGGVDKTIKVTAQIERQPLEQPNYTNVIIGPLNTVGLPSTTRASATPYGYIDENPFFSDDSSSVGVTPFRTTSLQHHSSDFPIPENRF